MSKRNWTDGIGKDEINDTKSRNSPFFMPRAQKRKGGLPYVRVKEFPQLLW